MDRNTATTKKEAEYMAVALHPEGVDRNSVSPFANAIAFVALHPEGVDRNKLVPKFPRKVVESPSTRRAWIEIKR